MPVDFGRLWNEKNPDYHVAVFALVSEVEDQRALIQADIDSDAKLRGG